MTHRRARARRKARRFARQMTREERLLVVVRRELYDGSWDQMQADLSARLAGRPYVFKLAHRIEDDLERIERLRQFERDCGVDLTEFVEPIAGEADSTDRG